MITLNDYLYSGDTLLRILQKYIEDLRKEARETHNEVDLVHCNFLLQIRELLEHNDFLNAHIHFQNLIYLQHHVDAHLLY